MNARAKVLSKSKEIAVLSLLLLFSCQTKDIINSEQCPICTGGNIYGDDSGELIEQFFNYTSPPSAGLCQTKDITIVNCTKHYVEVSCVFFWMSGNLSYIYKSRGELWGEVWGTYCIELDQSRRYNADWNCSFMAYYSDFAVLTRAVTSDKLVDPNSCRIGRTRSVWNWKDPDSGGKSSDWNLEEPESGGSSSKSGGNSSGSFYVISAVVGLVVLFTALLGFLCLSAKFEECTVSLVARQTATGNEGHARNSLSLSVD